MDLNYYGQYKYPGAKNPTWTALGLNLGLGSEKLLIPQPWLYHDHAAKTVNGFSRDFISIALFNHRPK
jgi:hypothetical protein